MEHVLREQPSDDDDPERICPGTWPDLDATGHAVYSGAFGGQWTNADLPATGAADDTEGLMINKIGSAVTAKVVQRITGPGGVNAGLGALTQAEREFAGLIDSSQVRVQNVAAEMAERALGVKYPAVNVYCEKIVNELREKFRTFSGRVQMAIELRQSQDRLEGIQDRLELYVDATMQMLNGSRGDWGDGMFFGGGYEVAFGPVKQGGKNFMQVAKVTFEIGVNRN